jgi:hypothetical protein
MTSLSFSEIRLCGRGVKESDNYADRNNLPHDLVRQKTLLVVGHAHALGMCLADTVFFPSKLSTRKVVAEQLS